LFTKRGRRGAAVSALAIVTVSLPRTGTFEGTPIAETMQQKGAASRCGLLIIDLRNGDIVQWLWLRGEVTELFDVGVFRISVVRAVSVLTRQV
jgi:protein O-GlcNAc transferase